MSFFAYVFVTAFAIYPSHGFEPASDAINNRIDRDWREQLPKGQQSLLDLIGHDYRSQSRIVEKLLPQLETVIPPEHTFITTTTTPASTVAVSSSTADPSSSLVTVSPTADTFMNPHPTSHVIPEFHVSRNRFDSSNNSTHQVPKPNSLITQQNGNVHQVNQSRVLGPVRLVLRVTTEPRKETTNVRLPAAVLSPGERGTTSKVTKPVNRQPETYVFDLLAPPIAPDTVVEMLKTAVPNVTYPALKEVPDESKAFKCTVSQVKSGGYYADISTGCQVFHRCGADGQATHYLCPEETIFNQISLNCDWWYNVNCSSSSKFVHFANDRLDSKLPLFDTPPKNFVPKWSASYYAQLASSSGSNPVFNPMSVRHTIKSEKF